MSVDLDISASELMYILRVTISISNTEIKTKMYLYKRTEYIVDLVLRYAEFFRSIFIILVI
jgi:hypothetical protein